MLSRIFTGGVNISGKYFFPVPYGKERPLRIKSFGFDFCKGTRKGTSMTMDAKETTALAEMLRIHISPEDAERLSGDMSSILDYVRKLDELDVSAIDPMAAGPEGYARLREDAPGKCLTREELETLSGGAFDPQVGAFVTKPIFA